MASIVRDPERLDQLVDAMAHCLSSVLSLKDTIGGDVHVYGDLMYEGINRFPTRSHLDYLETLYSGYKFVANACECYDQLRIESLSDPNVVLGQHALDPSYHNRLVCPRHRGECIVETVIGGIGYVLFAAVQESIASWLFKCDMLMCAVFQDTTHGKAGSKSSYSPKIVALVEELSAQAASRIVLVDGAMPESAEELRKKALSCAQPQAGFYALSAISLYRTDAHGDSLDALIRIMLVVIHMPDDWWDGENAKRMNKTMLCAACHPGRSAPERIMRLEDWRLKHGVCAALAAEHCLNIVQEREKSIEVQILCNPFESPPPNARALPAIPSITCDQPPFFLAEEQTLNSAGAQLDWIERRSLRLTSLVQQLLLYGCFERGVVKSSFVTAPATRGMHESCRVCQQITEKRDLDAPSQRLLCFTEYVIDRQSHLADQVSSACAELGRFSTKEIFEVFQQTSPFLWDVVPHLREQTSSMLRSMGAPMNPRYVTYIADVLDVVLPIVRDRRAAVGIAPYKRPNAVAELLRTLPRVRQWNPSRGKLYLELSDLKAASPLLIATLQELHRRNILCRFKRPYIAGRKHPKMAYVFDTKKLMETLMV
jgi:hypothetical protein